MKIGEFFEKHVQWIAMGLAALWLLYVGWTYGVNRPTVEISGETFSPGAVDEHIRESEADKLARKIADPSMPSGLSDVPDFTDAFVASMMAQPPKPLPFAYVRSDPPIDQIRNEYDPGRRRIREKVKDVPTVIVATDLTPLAGRTLVLQPPPAPKLAPNPNNNENNQEANNEVAVKPNNIFNEQAPQNNNQNGNVQQVGADAQLDKTWVTIFAKLNIEAQKREFERVKIPASLTQLMFIEVQMQRQEVEPDGKLGPIEFVKGLPMNQPPVDRKMHKDFINWAANAESQKMILIPDFYKWVRGTAWEIPQKDIQVADANANNPPPVEQFDPSAKYQEWKNAKNQLERNKVTESMTPEQRRIFTKFRLDEEEKERRSKAPQPPPRGNRPGGGAGGTGGTGTGGTGGRQIPPPRGGRENFDNGDAIDPALLREMYADADPNAPQNRRYPRRGGRDIDFDSPDGVPMRRRGNEEEGFIDQPQRQGNVLGNITPDKDGNVDVWAHDETAQPGRTYRYRLRVVIANPLYDTNIHADEKINKEPYLPLDANASWSDWTKPVAIPTNVDMMLVNAQVLGGREIARFKIKRFQKGQINDSKLFEAAPGDVIGGVEKAQGATEPIDFTTNWTVVDIRQTGGDFKVRIMDAQGRMETRTVNGDRNRFKEEAPAKQPGVAGAVGLARPRE